MTPDVFEDLVRLFHTWKRKPTRIKPKLRHVMGLSGMHQAARLSLYYWGMTAVRFGFQADWWISQQTKKKTPPPFARAILEIMTAKSLSSGGLSSSEVGLAMTLFKRHFPKPVSKWAYALLKKLQMSSVSEDLASAPPNVQAGLTEWIFRRLYQRSSDVSEDAFAKKCMAKNVPHPISMRFDPRRFTRSEALTQLRQGFSQNDAVELIPQTSSPWGLYVKGAGRPIEEMPLFKNASLSIQSESSIVIGDIVSHIVSSLPSTVYRLPSSGSLKPEASLSPLVSLLDMAASPGGKTLMLWQHLGPKVIGISAMARDPKAHENLMRNLKRDETCQVHTFIHDVTQTKVVPTIERYDLILCDAPCSNLGTVFSKPDVKYIHPEEDFESLINMQLTFLDQAVCLLKPGGRLLHVVCSQEPEETDDVIQTFLRMYPDFQVEKVPLVCDGLRETPYGAMMDWFARPYWDGYYIAVLKKSGDYKL